jgi:DNA ligase-1
MDALAQTCERIGATTKKSQKLAILADYFNSREQSDAAISAIFLSGRPFPAFDERTLQVGGSLLWKIAAELTGTSEHELRAAYKRWGDLGSAAAELWTHPREPVVSERIVLADVRRAFDEIAATRGTAGKQSSLKALLAGATALEAKYILKIITGDLRIGLKESLVEEAIAKTYGEPAAMVQRANMLLGDIAETLLLAADHRLGDARMRLFHPIGFMLASPTADTTEAFEYFQHARVEDKYDGIRAQAHCAEGKARLFSRTLDDVTRSFPELVAPLSEFPRDAILDGEIVAWKYNELGGHAMPFTEIQKRLGRKQVDREVISEAPVAYVVFDVLYAEGELLLDRPLAERVATLDRLFPAGSVITPKPVPSEQGSLLFESDTEDAATSGWILRAPAREVDSPQQLETLFDEAMARGNEGLMIKDVESPYLPGRRGRWWLKLKRELATLDVVITAAEFGHGKRIHVLSDYTFAVRNGEELVNIGKAYSGLTDAEIAEMTEWLLAHTTADHGFSRQVEPKMVLEVAFNAIMRSERHSSGYALRFPRIVRIRTDKLPGDINTVEDVEAIYLRQHGRGAFEQSL